jgi:hypothetical protein
MRASLLLFVMARRRAIRPSSSSSLSIRNTLPPELTLTTSGSSWPEARAACVCGRSTCTVEVSSGAVIMKMTSSTSITSTNGVTLISATRRAPRREAPRRPDCIRGPAMAQFFSSSWRDRIAPNSDENVSSRPA